MTSIPRLCYSLRQAGRHLPPNQENSPSRCREDLKRRLLPPAEFGGQQVNVHQIVVQNNGTSYIVVYTDLPSSLIQKGSQQVLDELSNKFLTNMGLQELKNSGKKIELDGNPGREFQTGDSGKFFGMRVYLVGQRSYLLLTQAPTSRDVNQFLSSFQLH